LVIDDALVVELKSVERLLTVHKAQVLTHLKLTGLPLGLLINFFVPRLVEGVSRVVNGAGLALSPVDQSGNAERVRVISGPAHRLTGHGATKSPRHTE
jgi:hypothetical protein